MGVTGMFVVLYLEPDWSYLDFLNAASNRLGTGPTAMRCFNSDGKILARLWVLMILLLNVSILLAM